MKIERALVLAAALVIGFGTASSAHGESIRWIRTSDGDWMTASNWDLGRVPATDDSVYINNGTTVSLGDHSFDLGDGWLRVGSSWTGRLVVTSGRITTLFTLIGGSHPDVSEVVFTDGAVLTSRDLFIGEEGTGALTVADGASLQSVSSDVGYWPGATGTVLVTGNGSVWAASGVTRLGKGGTGTLTIADSAHVNFEGDFILGAESDGVGTLNIGEGAAPGTLAAHSITRGDGTGVVNFNHTDPDYYFTHDGTASGTANRITGRADVNHIGPGTTILTGENSLEHTTINQGTLVVEGGRINNRSEFYVGDATGDDGALVVRDGGDVTASNYFGIGRQAGSVGEVTVTGEDSALTIGWLAELGASGVGTLTIADGGNVDSYDAMFVGNSGSGVGSVVVTGAGSVLTHHSYVNIGYGGNGTLTISNGGFVESGNATLASGSTGTGTALITGVGSIWEPTRIAVGYKGDGVLTVADHGRVDTGGVSLAEDAVDSTGTLNIGDGAEPGFLAATNVSGGIGDAVVNFNHTATDYHFTDDGTATGTPTPIVGTATVNHIGTGTTIFTGANTYTGGTNIHQGTLVVQGDGRVHHPDAGMMAGYDGSDVGTLIIRGGGGVTSGYSGIGLYGDSTGEALVTGAGSFWTIGSDLTIGGNSTASGTLTVADGGALSVDGSIYLSSATNSSGTLNVGTGAGAGIINADSIVGGSGGATLNINHTDADVELPTLRNDLQLNHLGTGTTVLTNSDSAIWGGIRIHQGALVVDGGRLLNRQFNAPMYVGSNPGDDGAFIVRSDGTVETYFTALGWSIGSAGHATVTGADTNWTNLDQMYVGYEGAGFLVIEDGGELNSENMSLGHHEDGAGDVTVSGAGSQWNASDGIVVGRSGTGTLTVADGGTIVTNLVQLGSQSTGDGTLNIGDGALPGLVDADEISGGSGDAVVNFNHAATDHHFTDDGTVAGTPTPIGGTTTVNHIGTGTTVFTGANTYTGDTNIHHGALIVQGAGQIHDPGGVIQVGVDAGDDGTLIVRDGGTVRSSVDTIGGGAGSVGHVSVTGVGSRWLNRELNVGFGGAGSVAVEDGGYLDSLHVWLGRDEGGAGEVSVTGGDARVIALHVGIEGTGSVVVEEDGTLVGTHAWLGYNEGGVGEVTVTGADSGWAAANALHVGFEGTGSVIVEDGGELGSMDTWLGYNEGGVGQVTVTGADSEWSVFADLHVGFEGTGSVIVEDGGELGSMDTWLGYNERGAGELTLSGMYSRWSADDEIVVGHSGTGTLTVADGGTITADRIWLGHNATGEGTLNVGDGALPGIIDADEISGGSGDAVVNFNHTATDYRLGTTLITGSVAVNHIGSGTTTFTEAHTYTGGTDIVGGTLVVDNTTGSATGTGSVNVGNGATLAGAGFVAGAVTVADGGMLAPGNSPGTLTVGELALSGDSILDFELGAPTGTAGVDHDLIDVVADLAGSGSSGDLTLDGILNVTDLGGFGAPGSYRLIDYDGALTDHGLALGTGLVAGFDYDIDVATTGQVNLVLDTSRLQFWDGTGTPSDGVAEGGSGAWDAASTNWTNSVGNPNGQWDDLTAVFAGAAGTVDVVGTHSITGLQFGADGQVLQGGALAMANDTDLRADGGVHATVDTALTGAGGIIKTGAGEIVLGGANTYEGGIVVMDGVLRAGVATAFVAGAPVEVNGGTFDLGGFDLAVSSLAGLGGTIALDGATLTVDQASDTLYVGAMTGTGSLVKDGAGVLALTGANTYSGGTTVAAGTLVGDATSLQGDITNDASVVFDQATDATFAGDITGGGTTIKDGAGVLTLTGVSGQSWAIDAGGLVSSSDRFTGDATIAAAASFVLTQDSDSSYGGVLSGSGLFETRGDGVLTLTADSSAFAGTTEVNGGGLALGPGGALGGSFQLNGGTLSGTGTYGTVTLGQDAVVAPGFSIGTLNVTGDLTFAADSVYLVEVDPAGTSADLIAVAGQAFLNGASVSQIGLSGTYDESASWTILTADGGIDGTFGEVASNFAYLDPSLSYSATAVTLTLARNDIPLPDVEFPVDEPPPGMPSVTGLTGNQAATAAGVEALGAGNPVYDAVVTLPMDEATVRGAFDALSGELHASVRSGLYEDSRFVRDAITYRAAERDDARRAVWARTYGTHGRVGGSSNVAGLSRDHSGLLGGADINAGNVKLGFAASAGRLTVDAGARHSRASVDSTTLALYGGRTMGPVSATVGLAHGRYQVDTMRTIEFPGFVGTSAARYDATQLQLFGELAWNRHEHVEPFVQLARVSLDTDSFVESGDAALAGDGEDRSVTFGTLGLRGEWSRDRWSFSGLTAWRRASGAKSPTASLTSGAVFDVTGATLAEDAMVLEGDFAYRAGERTSFGVSYHGMFGDGTRDHGASAQLTVWF